MARFEMSAASMAVLAPATADGQSYFELGCMYEIGRGVAADLVVAHKWFNIAAARGYAPAAGRRSEVAADMSTAEIATAQREARLWLARQGS